MPVANHAGDARIFQRDRSVPLHQRGAQFVQVFFALTGDVYLLALNCQQGLATIIRTALRSRQLALQETELLLGSPGVVRVLNFHPIGEGRSR